MKDAMTAKKNPPTPELELAELIGRVARRWHHLAEQSFASLRLNHTEARVLTTLERHGGTATQDVLSSQLSVDRSNAGRALTRLENNGMVVRRRDDADARTKVVAITESGRAATKELAGLRAEVAADLLGPLGNQELKSAIESLRKVFPDEL